MTNFITYNNVRIVDIFVESISPFRFTVTYVSTGAYAKWWWRAYDVDEVALNNQLSTHTARLILLSQISTFVHTNAARLIDLDYVPSIGR